MTKPSRAQRPVVNRKKPPVPRNKPRKTKTCDECGAEFSPNSGRQVRCDDCRGGWKRQPLSNKERTKDQPERRTPGRELRGSPVALGIEERMLKRNGPMERVQEEDDGAT